MELKPFYIREAKRRAKAIGLDPVVPPSFPFVMNKEQLARKQQEYEEILAVVRFFNRKLLYLLRGTPLLIVVTDADGFVLEMEGDELIKKTVFEFGIQPGVQFTEEHCGPNGISLSLALRKPLQLIGTDHYHTCLHTMACYSVPFQYSDMDDLLGTISIMTSIEHANPFFLTSLVMVVDAIERELILRRQNRALDLLNQIMLQNTSNGIIITDEKGCISEFNCAAERLTGFKKEDMIGRSVLQLEQLGAFIFDVIERGNRHENIQIKIEPKDSSSSVILLFDAFPIFDKNNKLIGAYGQFRDITEQQKTKEFLQKTDRLSLIGELAAGMAHEIRNPLTSLRGFIQLLQGETKKYREYFKIMLDEMERINLIVSEFLILAKPQVMQIQPKDISQLLQQVLVLMEADARQNHVQIRCHWEENLPFVKCEESQLKQVFINVIKNAIESMPKGGEITVEAKALGESQVLIRVIDQGCGIPREQLSKLGEPFFTTKENGTGLGLMVSYMIIQAHQGSLYIDSQVNHGTTVEVVLPSV